MYDFLVGKILCFLGGKKCEWCKKEAATEALFQRELEEKEFVEGEVDSVENLTYGNRRFSEDYTKVGFLDGNGMILIGLHPGLRKGKKVKITFYKLRRETLNGTPAFRVIQIEEKAGGMS